MINIEELQINDIVLYKKGSVLVPTEVSFSVLVDIAIHPRKYFPIELTEEFFKKNKFKHLDFSPEEELKPFIYIVHKDFYDEPDLAYLLRDQALVLVHKDTEGTIRFYHGFSCKYLHELQQFLRHFDDYKSNYKNSKFVC